MQITSLQNKRIKNLVKLRQRRQRDAQKLTVVEGLREISLALDQRIVPREAYYCPGLEGWEALQPILDRLAALAQNGGTDLYEVTPDVFSKIAYRGDSGGILLVVPYFHQPLESLALGPAPFLVVIENVEKPGNLGAILRTADAAGVDAVVVCSDTAGSGTDVHNPNVVRASLGALFTVPVAVGASSEVITWLRQRQIQIIAATPAAQQVYSDIDMTAPAALVMGSESHGLTELWLSAADLQVLIPMKGAVDSLNLAVSTALLLYECVRQRGAVPVSH